MGPQVTLVKISTLLFPLFLFPDPCAFPADIRQNNKRERCHRFILHKSGGKTSLWESVYAAVIHAPVEDASQEAVEYNTSWAWALANWLFWPFLWSCLFILSHYSLLWLLILGILQPSRNVLTKHSSALVQLMLIKIIVHDKEMRKSYVLDWRIITRATLVVQCSILLYKIIFGVIEVVVVMTVI